MIIHYFTNGWSMSTPTVPGRFFFDGVDPGLAVRLFAGFLFLVVVDMFFVFPGNELVVQGRALQ